MKISVGINGFKEYSNLEKREKFCIESLLKFKNSNKNVELYNICFKEENIKYDNFTTLNKLTKKSDNLIREYYNKNNRENDYYSRQSEIDNNTKHLPSVKEIFDVLASTDCDYFLFLNNDIILSNRLLKELEDDVESYVISRLNIQDIDSLNDIPKPNSYSVHGYDAFFIKKETWLRIRGNFDDYILGRFYWDTFFATIFNLFSNCKIINKLPAVCFHIDHPASYNTECIEHFYTGNMFNTNLFVSNIWFTYVYSIPMKRVKQQVEMPLPNEKELEKQYFSQFNQNILFNKDFKKLDVTNNKDYDLFIPLHPKDEVKLPYVIEHATKHLNYKNIFVCSPYNISNKITDTNISYINDKDILDIPDTSFIGFRPNWIYQQFLKLSFNLSSNQYYFVLDADTVIIKDLSLFENDSPIWYYGGIQNHLPYFLFNKKIFNLDKSLDHTGIGDVGFFNKNIVQSFLNYTGCSSFKDLLYMVGKKTSPFFHFSEYETYANFVNTYYPDLYTFKKLKQVNKGRDLNLKETPDWTAKDIEDVIAEYSNTDKQILSLHSWKI